MTYSPSQREGARGWAIQFRPSLCSNTDILYAMGIQGSSAARTLVPHDGPTVRPRICGALLTVALRRHASPLKLYSGRMEQHSYCTRRDSEAHP